MLQSPTSGGGASSAALKKATLARKTAKEKKFGAADIAKGLSNPYIQGAAQGTDIAAGESVASSAKNVVTGKATPMDALNLGLAATSFVGLGAPAASKALASKALASAVKKPAVAARIPASRVQDIMTSGGLKNVFDASRAAGWGAGDDAAAYLSQRKFIEQQALGIPETASAAERPIYGYLYKPGLPVLPGNSEIANASKILSRNNPGVQSYGDFTAVMKNVPQNSTYTLGDTFRSWTGGRANQLGTDMANPNALSGLTNKQIPYVEAQLPQEAGAISNMKLLAPDVMSMKGTRDWLKANNIDVPVGLNLQEVLANPAANLKQLGNLTAAKKAELVKTLMRSPQYQKLRNSLYGKKVIAGEDPFATPVNPFE